MRQEDLQELRGLIEEECQKVYLKVLTWLKDDQNKRDDENMLKEIEKIIKSEFSNHQSILKSSDGIVGTKMKNDDETIEKLLNEMMKKLGAPSHLKGCHYAKQAIILCIKDEQKLSAMTKQLYPDVAKIFKTTSSRVERAMRHMIERVWNKGDINYINELFGNTVEAAKGKPTNSEFLSLMTEEVKMKLKSC